MKQNRGWLLTAESTKKSGEQVTLNSDVLGVSNRRNELATLSLSSYPRLFRLSLELAELTSRHARIRELLLSKLSTRRTIYTAGFLFRCALAFPSVCKEYEAAEVRAWPSIAPASNGWGTC